MRVTIFHNPTAGEDDIRVPDLLATLRAAGHEAVYYSLDDKSVFDRVQDPGDVLLAAGGDGTVRKVALRLGRLGAPIAVLPLGTANNVATALGVPDGLDAAIAALEHGRRVRFDLGHVHYGGHAHRFLEGAGVGLFAEAMVIASEHGADDVARSAGADAELARDLQLLRSLLPLQRAAPCQVEVDGVALDGDALLVEIMNIPSVGPNLRLAPDADHGDGRLDVVVATEPHRAALGAYLDARLAGDDDARPALPVTKGSRVRLRWHSPVGHIDDERLPDGDGVDGGPLEFAIGVEPGAVRFIVP